jgi:hypothetical protein
LPDFAACVETIEVAWIPSGRQLSVLWSQAVEPDIGESVVSKAALNRNRNTIDFSFRMKVILA